MSIDISPLLRLPINERISLIKALANSLESDMEESGSLTPAQIEETNSIIRQIDQGETKLSPWKEARKRIIRSS